MGLLRPLLPGTGAAEVDIGIASRDVLQQHLEAKLGGAVEKDIGAIFRDEVVASEQHWKDVFKMMTLCFGIVFGAVTTPIVYASSVLQPEIGNAANAILFMVTMLTSLFVAPIVDSSAGPKWGLILAFIAYSLYVICFAAAALSCGCVAATRDICRVGGIMQWSWAIGGSILGGVGSGVLWPCQGSYFTAIVERVTKARLQHKTDDGPEHIVASRVTSELSSSFAAGFLMLECTAKACFTLMQRYLHLRAGVAFFMYGAAAILATLCFFFSEDVRCEAKPAHGIPVRETHFKKAWQTVRLWKDPLIWLLMFTNMTFGISVSWMNGYVNSTLLAEASSNTDLIGFLGAGICLVAAGSSKIFGCFGKRYGKYPVVLLGSICFFLIGSLSCVGSPGGNWGYGVFVFYVLQGLGRGVYESTNKGIFADLFQGPDALGAFANAMVQQTIAAAIGFCLLASHNKQPILYLLLFFSALTFPSLCLAHWMKSSK
jgi:MFS family permease